MTDNDVCKELGINLNSLKKLRKEAKILGLLEHREQISPELLKTFSEVLRVQKSKGGRRSYSDAFEVIRVNQRLLEKICFENADTRASKLFEELLKKNGLEKNLDDMLNAFVTITDILTQIGDKESVAILHSIQDSIIKKNAFIMLDSIVQKKLDSKV